MNSLNPIVKIFAERGDVEHRASVQAYIEGPRHDIWIQSEDTGYIDGDSSRPLALTKAEMDTAIEEAHEWLRETLAREDDER